MALMLGIDTGGTFTDAALVRADEAAAETHETVLATAKAPTTHHDLSIGLDRAIRSVLAEAPDHSSADIALVSVSTTLATNALVEGQGEPAAVVALGLDPRDIDRADLTATVGPDLVRSFVGGHDAHGNERALFPEGELRFHVAEVAPKVSAFAVVSQFSVRNPAHELAAAALIRAETGLPVTMSHELSARLDGPRRALTAALNARLLGTITRLNVSLRAVLESLGVDAPLMVVRGDGSLVTADFAQRRPIETILSGPAASVVGALHLAGSSDAVIADIGGTTTDVAVVTGGRPRVADRGAVVGGHRTMVQAVELATTGLGGDSEIRIDTRDPAGPLVLGPDRAIPIGRLAVEHPAIGDLLEAQRDSQLGQMSHGRFLLSTGPVGSAGTAGSTGAATSRSRSTAGLDDREREILDRLAAGPLPEADAAPSARHVRAAARLRARGLVRVATMTPTDAQAVLGRVPGIDATASRLIAEIMAAKTSSTGAPVAPDGETLAAAVIDRLCAESARFVIGTALAVDSVDAGVGDALLSESIRRRQLGGAGAVSRVQVGLGVPLVAIGAPAATWYPAVAELAGTTPVIAEHAEVANAIGAVVGQVRVRRSCTITQPTRGQYRVHLGDQPAFGSVDNARAYAAAELESTVGAEALDAGATAIEVHEHFDATTAMVNGKELFVEGTLTVEATGRPRFA